MSDTVHFVKKTDNNQKKQNFLFLLGKRRAFPRVGAKHMMVLGSRGRSLNLLLELRTLNFGAFLPKARSCPPLQQEGLGLHLSLTSSFEIF